MEDNNKKYTIMDLYSNPNKVYKVYKKEPQKEVSETLFKKDEYQDNKKCIKYIPPLSDKRDITNNDSINKILEYINPMVEQCKNRTLCGGCPYSIECNQELNNAPIDLKKRY